jgi:thioester reductase-like protein
VPRVVVPLAELPLSANGKVNAAALPDIDIDQGASAAKLAPRTPREQAVLDIWRQVIPGLDIGIEDNFFELGGDSVLATQLLRELNTTLGVQLEMHELFENLTVAGLAQLLDQRDAAAPTHDQAVRTGLLAEAELLLRDVAALTSAGLPHGVTAQPPRPLRTVMLTGATGWVGAHLLAQVLRSSHLDVVCLVRGADEADARRRLATRLAEVGEGLLEQAQARVTVLRADLREARFGLSEDAWLTLRDRVDGVFHLAATVGVLQAYEAHRQVNVLPLAQLIELGKPVFTLSPMTVCRRLRDGQVELLTGESLHPHADGLLTGYAQSKWVAEQVLWQAGAEGLPVRIYRTSHALPPSVGTTHLPHDATMTVLALASEIDVVPQWPQARVHGVPVDRLCETLVQDVLACTGQSAIVHLEHLTPSPLVEVLRHLVRPRVGQDHVDAVPLAAWRERCLEAAGRLPAAQESLARGLFEAHGERVPVEHIFGADEIQIRHMLETGQAERLANLTPASYWMRLLGRARVGEEVTA